MFGSLTIVLNRGDGQCNLAERIGLQPKIDAGTFQSAMTKQITDQFYANPSFEKPHCERMA
jgi:hypothetical protein